MQRKIQVETSQFDPDGYWVPGGEYFAVDAILEYPARLDHLTDEELAELADENQDEVYYINEVTQ